MALILIEGSSSAYGLWGGEGGGWADRLKREYLANPNRSEPASVVNLAAPLRNIDTITESLPRNMAEYASRSRARVALFMVGMVESRLFDDKYDTPPDDFRRSLGQIGLICAQAEFAPIYLGMTPVDEDLSSYLKCKYTNDARHEYDSIVREEAKNQGADYIDIAARLKETHPKTEEIIDEDGIHVNDIGHAAVHRIVSPYVRRRLDSLRRAA